MHLQWEIIAGAYNLHYYYNPKTYVMQWSKPAGAVVCEVSQRYVCSKMLPFFFHAIYDLGVVLKGNMGVSLSEPQSRFGYKPVKF